jgi:hypothetical protein
MFPVTKDPIDSEGERDLIALGQSMKAKGIERATFTARAGMTYLGQFIGHDLAGDRTPVATRDVEPMNVRNHRDCRLDLQLMYGGGPNDSPNLYAGETGEERFRIGETIDGPGMPGGTKRDFSRDENGQVLLADERDARNLENLLVMQIQVLFMKFHNVAVEQCDDTAFTALPLKGSKFERAQQVVRWHYQWLVRRVFLAEVLDGATLHDVQKKGPHIKWHDPGFFVPAEFALAAFRFGHSMVRNSYKLNSRRERVSLSELVGHRFLTSRLSEDCLVEWGRIFRGLLRTGQTSPSSPINTAIAADLHVLSAHALRLCSHVAPGAHFALPVLTLLRGARARLPSGQEVASILIKNGLLSSDRALSRAMLISKNAVTDDDSADVLSKSRLLHNTPLFYYILKEAEVIGKGRKLGPVGSRIVAEVIEMILQRDPQSYLNRLGPAWTPPACWTFPNTRRRPVDSMSEIVRLIGDALPNGCQLKSRN